MAGIRLRLFGATRFGRCYPAKEGSRGHDRGVQAACFLRCPMAGRRPGLRLTNRESARASRCRRTISAKPADAASGSTARAAGLATNSSVTLPEATGITRAEAYFAAREQAVRTVSSLANTRARELGERLEKHVARMNRYYDDLLGELNEQSARAASRDGEADGKFHSQRDTLASERELRIAELRRKNSLTARMRLLNALIVHQPKFEIRATIAEPAPSWSGVRPFIAGVTANAVQKRALAWLQMTRSTSRFSDTRKICKRKATSQSPVLRSYSSLGGITSSYL